MERFFNHQTIDEFLLDITETAEYKSIEYLIFSIRMNYLHYMAISRIVKFEIPKYLENLIGIVIDKFNESGISTVDMLQYMLDNDINNWIHYYAYTFIIPVAKGEENKAVNDLSELYAFVLTGYILDTFREKRIDIGNRTISGAWHGCLYVLHCGKETIKITQDIFRLTYHSAGTSDF